MKKAVIKSLVIVLIFTLLGGGGIVSALAAEFSFPPPEVTDEQWDAVWNEIDETNSAVALTPGSNESERNFAWQSGAEAQDPAVMLSLTNDMSEPVTFTGTSILNKLTGMLTNYVTVKGLEPDTVYYYQCSTTLDESGVYSFKTGAEGALKVIVVADIHIESSEDGAITEKTSGMVWNKFLEKVVAREPDVNFIMAAGDNANVGAAREYLGLFAPPVLKSIPLATCIGNHDKKDYHYRYYMNNPNAYKSLLGGMLGDDYWYRYGDALFLVYDSTNGSAYDHFNFTKKACDANPDAKWRIAMFHHDLHATIASISKNFEDRAQQLILDPIISHFDVDAVIVGHNHRYIRTNVLKGGRVVQSTFGKSEITDPKGAIYFGNTSINHVNTSSFPGVVLDLENAFFLGEGVMTYQVLTFSEGRMNMKLYRLDDGTVADEFTIKKSAGNMPQTGKGKPLGYNIVTVLTFIYALVAKIVEMNNFNQLLNK
ncbi:MAG: metallophosphoesterase [Oscillospiraceae bacterium]|nr:metallophosphoesterase [Oscillospiraceae bacterium]